VQLFFIANVFVLNNCGRFSIEYNTIKPIKGFQSVQKAFNSITAAAAAALLLLLLYLAGLNPLVIIPNVYQSRIACLPIPCTYFLLIFAVYK